MAEKKGRRISERGGEMTLDEAIKHCEEVAEDNERDGRLYADLDSYKASECVECASEHRQLAEWLKDYKRLLYQNFMR